MGMPGRAKRKHIPGYNFHGQAKVRQVSSDDRLLVLEGQRAVGSPASTWLALLFPLGSLVDQQTTVDHHLGLRTS
ncbi:unnamed protein product [Lota lota]